MPSAPAQAPRDVSVSPTALARLASTLRLQRAERAYLFELAGKRDPDHAENDVEDLSPAVSACVAMMGAPAYLLDRTWTARTWNAQAERLLLGWLDQPGDKTFSALLC